MVSMQNYTIHNSNYKKVCYNYNKGDDITENNENLEKETKNRFSIIIVLLIVIIILIFAIMAAVLVKKGKTEGNSNTNETIVEKNEEDNVVDNADVFDYEGTWYLSEEQANQETLKLTKTEEDTYNMNIFFYRIASIQDTTVKIENNTGTFKELTEDGNYFVEGTVNLNDGKVEIEITNSTVEYISQGKTYSFEYKSN